MTLGANSQAQLRSVVDRVENVRAKKKELQDDEKAIMAEAKSNGFDPKGIRYVLKARAMKPHDRQEAEAIRDTYMHAVGMAQEPPLFRALGAMSNDAASRESVIGHFLKLVPENGEVIVKVGGAPVRIWRDRGGEPQWEPYEEPEPATAPGVAAPKVKPPVPDTDDAGAAELGRRAAKDNKPVTENPFPFGDPRRPIFDEAWRNETGNDGMGDDED